VTFILPGFTAVSREGIELSGTFIANVNGTACRWPAGDGHCHERNPDRRYAEHEDPGNFAERGDRFYGIKLIVLTVNFRQEYPLHGIYRPSLPLL
jgi:hypothetical protein